MPPENSGAWFPCQVTLFVLAGASKWTFVYEIKGNGIMLGGCETPSLSGLQPKDPHV